MSDLYAERKLTEGYPEMDRLVLEFYSRIQHERVDEPGRIEQMLRYIERLVSLARDARMAVVGCGPVPTVVAALRSRGFSVVGIEPVPEFADAAREYLEDDHSVLMGAAESLPLEDASQDVIWLESVIEHVESPLSSLSEIFRVLRPGGLLWVTTSNRQRLRFMGKNDEFSVRFLQWMPALLRESYIFEHLHYRPELASFTRRPAVHWFTFSSLCSLGRLAGFAQFYSPLDLRRAEDVLVSGSPIKRLIQSVGLLPMLQRNAWLRSLALTQLDSEVFMWKRGDPPKSSVPGSKVERGISPTSG